MSIINDFLKRKLSHSILLNNKILDNKILQNADLPKTEFLKIAKYYQMMYKYVNFKFIK